MRDRLRWLPKGLLPEQGALPWKAAKRACRLRNA
jgi:hypothetical protein